MELKNLPIDGAFMVYRVGKRGNVEKVCAGCEPSDVPEEFKGAQIKRIYPYDDAIIIEIYAEV